MGCLLNISRSATRPSQPRLLAATPSKAQHSNNRYPPEPQPMVDSPGSPTPVPYRGSTTKDRWMVAASPVSRGSRLIPFGHFCPYPRPPRQFLMVFPPVEASVQRRRPPLHLPRMPRGRLPLHRCRPSVCASAGKVTYQTRAHGNMNADHEGVRLSECQRTFQKPETPSSPSHDTEPRQRPSTTDKTSTSTSTLR